MTTKVSQQLYNQQYSTNFKFYEKLEKEIYGCSKISEKLDSKELFNNYLRLQKRVVSSTSQNSDLKINNFDKKIAHLEEENACFQQSIISLQKLLEKEINRRLALSEELDAIASIYQKTVADKQSAEDKLSKALKERDNAELQLITQKLEIDKMQNDLREEHKKLIDEKKQLKLQKKQMSEEKLSNIGNNILHESKEYVGSKEEIINNIEIEYSFGQTKIPLLQKKENDLSPAFMNLSISSSQRFLASCCYDSSIKIVDMYTKSPFASFQTNSLPSVSQFCSKDSLLAIGTQKSSIEMYCYRSQKKLSSLNGHGEVVTSLGELESHKLVSGSLDRTCKIWDIKKDIFERSIIFDSATTALVTSGNKIISGHYDGSIRVSSYLTKKREMVIEGFDSGVTSLLCGSHDNQLIGYSKTKELLLIDLRKNGSVENLEINLFNSSTVSKSVVAFDGITNSIVYGCSDGMVRVNKISSKPIDNEVKREVKVSDCDIPLIIEIKNNSSFVCGDVKGNLIVLDKIQ